MNSRITVTLVLNGEEHDFSLPADTQIKDYEGKLTALLPEVFRGLSPDAGILYLKNQDGFFSTDRALRDYGVMDGARVEVVYL